MSECQLAIWNLHCGIGFITKLPHGFNNLCHAASVRGMVVTQTATVGIKRKLAI